MFTISALQQVSTTFVNNNSLVISSQNLVSYHKKCMSQQLFLVSDIFIFNDWLTRENRKQQIYMGLTFKSSLN